MHDDLKKEVERMCGRERVLASARARAMSMLFEIVQRRHDPLTYEVQTDHEEDQEGDYR
jgi:hypothetical protein